MPAQPSSGALVGLTPERLMSAARMFEYPLGFSSADASFLVGAAVLQGRGDLPDI